MTADLVVMRLATAEDEPFIKALFSAVRLPEFAPLQLPAAELQALLDMQYRAMRQHYEKAFPDAVYSILTFKEQAIGYQAVNDEKTDLHLIDIALVAEARNGGIGTAQLKALQREAINKGKGIYLYVEGFNPAMKLYERMGFKIVGEEGIHRRMNWRPEA